MFSANILANMTMRREELTSFLSRDGVGAIVLFLYYHNHRGLAEVLTQAFHQLNRYLGNEIDLWTYYNEDGICDPPNNRYVDTYLMQMEIRDRFIKMRGNSPIDRNAFENMRLLGLLFEVDITIDPWFVILNPENGLYIKHRYNSNDGNILIQIDEIIRTIEDTNFNWDALSDRFKKPYNAIQRESIEQKLKEYIQIITKGFNINDLIQEGYNEDYLKKYMHNKYHNVTTNKGEPRFISLKDFLFNIKSLCKDNMEKQNKLKEIIDGYLPLLGMPGVNNDLVAKKAFEPSSYSYLCYAQRIASERIGGDDSKFSLSCYCYARALEEEINLGLVQKIRNSLGINMPYYYARYANNQTAILECDCENGIIRINYNERNGNGNSLRYPDISKTRQLLFDDNFGFDHNGILTALKQYVRNVFNHDESDLIKDIFRIRNNAVHSDTLLKESDYIISKEKFENLLQNNFFYYNNRIKKELR